MFTPNYIMLGNEGGRMRGRQIFLKRYHFFADMCAEIFPLGSMGGQATLSSVHKWEARTPTGTRGYFVICLLQ